MVCGILANGDWCITWRSWFISTQAERFHESRAYDDVAFEWDIWELALIGFDF